MRFAVTVRKGICLSVAACTPSGHEAMDVEVSAGGVGGKQLTDSP